MATDNLTALTEQFDSLIGKLSASSRRQLSRDIARSLRASQAAVHMSQENPAFSNAAVPLNAG